MGERKFCYKCMGKYEMEMHKCPNCGYEDTTPFDPDYIEPGIVLNDRYMVGIVLSCNGEGVTYVGYDISTGCKVMIREYMPEKFCTRVKNKPKINVDYNDVAKYKAFMVEYTELYKSLAQLRNNSNICPVLDMFSENNTTYIVFEYLDGKKMKDYLKDNAGELSWEQVSKLFPPLFTTIGILHNSGIIHRAISPETIFINNKGELKLSGFCISAIRTVDAGLNHELFKGYAAPEQYSASISSRQGSWTDVYAICALLYRALTGCMPTDSQTRLKNDDLCEPATLNKRIPAHVSKAIMEGMCLDSNNRIQTITELVTKLFEQPAQKQPPVQESPTIQQPALNPQDNRGLTQQFQYPSQQQQVQQQYPPQQPQQQYYNNNQNVNPVPPPVDPRYNQQPQQPRRQKQQPPQEYEDYKYEKVSTVDRLKVPVIITILLLAILVIIAVFIMRLFVQNEPQESSFSRNPSSFSENIVADTTESAEQPTESLPDTLMPNFVGKFFTLSEEQYADYFVFNVEYVYNDKYEIDIIMEQDIEEGTKVSQGTIVNLKVSNGVVGADIPSYSGLTVSQYENALKQAGISNYSFIASSNYGTPDTISQLQVDGKEVKAGTYFSNEEGKKLIVYYIPENAEGQEYMTTVAQTTRVYVTTASTTTAAASTAASTAATTAAPTTAPPTTAPPATDPPPPPATDPPPVVTDPPPVYTDPPAPPATDPPAPPPVQPEEPDTW